jgi:long-chain fatty acid transport protein
LATGFRLPDQDAFATARGEAFAATADNPSAIFYNPAGITQLTGQQFRGGIYGIKTDTDYTAPGGQEFDNRHDLHVIPQLFYTVKLESLPLALGLGVYSPYGLSNEWPEDTGFRTVATRGRLSYFTINPVIAWEITPGLSIAAGPSVNFADLDLRQGFATPLPGLGDVFSFEGQGWAAGYNAGVLWKLSPQVQLGVNYRSATTVDFEGHSKLSAPVDLRTPAAAEWDFPQMVVAGISFRPTPAWNLEFNVDWTGWDRLNTVVIHQAPLPDAGLVLNWESSLYYEFGATRYLAHGWTVSAGYIYNENSVPDATYNPIVADLNRHFLSAGFGHRGARFDFDFAYQFGYGPTRTVTGSTVSAFGQSADGNYEFQSHALFITGGWHF